MDRQLDPEDIKREKRAERLRRSYEALGKEQNGIFESLAEYTHEVQAEVRSLQIARDRLSEESAPGSGPGDDGGPPVVRFGRPLILTERWVSVEAAAVAIAVCGLLGVILGVRSSRRSLRLSQRGDSSSSSSSRPQQQEKRAHQD